MLAHRGSGEQVKARPGSGQWPDRGNSGSPAPTTPEDTGVTRLWPVRWGWRRDRVTWMRCSAGPEEHHGEVASSPQRAQRPALPWPPGPPSPGCLPPGTEAPRAGLPPPVPPPRNRIPTRHCRSEWWPAQGNWPAPSPRNSAGILDALK